MPKANKNKMFKMNALSLSSSEPQAGLSAP